VRRILIIVVSLRVGLGAVAALIVRVSAPDQGPLAGVLPHAGGTIAAYVIAPWERFDALNYERIASSGYLHGQLDQVFWPLFPLTERATSVVSGGSLGLAGMMVSTVAFVVALLLLRRLVAADVDAHVADLTVLYIALAPIAFFFFAPYSESLFVALSVGAIMAARHRRFVLAGSLCALATLTRAQGILVAIPVGIEALSATQDAWRAGKRPPWEAVPVLALSPALIAGFALYTKQVSGLSPFDAEKLWLVRFVPPWQGLIAALRAVRHHLPSVVNPAVGIAGLVGFVLMLLRRAKLPISYVAYTGASLLVIMSRQSDYAGGANPLVSSDRFALVVFPLFVVLAWLTRRHRTLIGLILAASVLLMVVRFTFYVHNSFGA
jgi:hypothetical protein